MQLSRQLKDSFQVVSLWATVLVVLIHYRSAESLSGMNGLVQEALLNAIARVAVPIFAFAAGLFYFISADGSWGCYADKLCARIRTVAVPYLLVSLLGFFSWALIRWSNDEALGMSFSGCLSRIVLHPMAEQLWFLRDLMLLVVVAPVIATSVRCWPRCTATIVSVLWLLNIQLLPIVGGWYLVNIETLTFFTLGCCAIGHIPLLEKSIRFTPIQSGVCIGAWIGLAMMRVAIDPTFDLWYVSNYTFVSLLVQKASIIAGMVALMSVSRWMNADRYRWLCGCSFFVYLAHEFPLREILQRVGTRIVSQDQTFYIAAPAALIACFTLAHLASQWTPRALSLLTGGRTPRRATSLGRY